MNKTTLITQKPWLIIAVGLFTLSMIFISATNTLAGITDKRQFDPLDNREQSKALDVLETEIGRSRASDQNQRREVLLIERHHESKDVYESGTWSRRADTYIYDYASDELIYGIVNLDTNEIEEVQRATDVQLPLNQNEIARALDIAYNDPVLQDILKQEFQAIEGENSNLTSLEQVEVKAFVFRSDSMPDGVNDKAKSCGIERCAQLLIYTIDTKIAFEILPIVNLSQDIVVQYVPFTPSSDHHFNGGDHHDHDH